MIRVILLLLAALLSPPILAVGTDWAPVKDQEGVQVYNRTVEGSSYKAVRATTVVRGSIEAAAALLRDYKSRPRWDALCADSHVLRAIDENEEWVYQHNALPWPVPDRDVLLRVRWAKDPATLAVTMHATAISGELPTQAGRVRITDARVSWVLTPLENGLIQISTEAHVNPAGSIPSWLVNALSVDAPFDSLMAIRKIVSSDRLLRGPDIES